MLSLFDGLVYGELLLCVGNEMFGSSSCQSTCDYHPRSNWDSLCWRKCYSKCLIQVNNTVDTSVTVAVVWSGSDGMAIINTSCYVVSPVTGSFPTYNATLDLSTLMMIEFDNYTCSATASPDSLSPFILSSERQSATLNITVSKTKGNMLCVQLVAGT